MTTDAYQGPNMANHAFHNLKVKKVYILDDSGAFGVGIADSFEQRATRSSRCEVLGRDRLDPKEADYKTILTKIKGLNPDAIYYGGVQQAAVKLARQLQEVMPKIHKLGSDGIYDLAFPEQSSKEAAEGWWASNASPDMLSDKKADRVDQRIQVEVQAGADQLLDHRVQRRDGHRRRHRPDRQGQQAGQPLQRP